MAEISNQARELGEHIHAIVLQARAIEASLAAAPSVDISRHELLAVEILGDSGSLIMRALAQQLYLAVNSVTTLVDNLEKKNLVRRERDTADRRLVWVHLTSEGQRVHRRNLDERQRLCGAMLESLNPQEQETYLLLTRKIARAALEYVSQAATDPPTSSDSLEVAAPSTDHRPQRSS